MDINLYVKLVVHTNKGDLDLTDRLTKVTYSQSVVHLDELIFAIFTDTLLFDTDETIRTNDKVTCTIGLSQQLTVKSKIVSIAYDYSIKNYSLTFNCSPHGYTTRQLGSMKVYYNKTASEIAESVAKDHNLTAFVDKTLNVYEYYPQAGDSDLKMLNKLATMEQGFKVHFSNTALYFKKQSYKVPHSNLVILDGGNCLNIRLSWTEVTKKFDIANSHYSKDGKIDVRELSVDLAVSTLSTKAEVGVILDRTGKKIKTKDSKGNSVTSDDGELLDKVNHVATKIKDSATNSVLAKNLLKNTKEKQLRGTITLLGNLNFKKDSVLYLKGIHPKYEGRFYLNKITHSITANSFRTNLDVNKNSLDKLPKNALDSSFDNVGKIAKTIQATFFGNDNKANIGEEPVVLDRTGKKVKGLAPTLPPKAIKNIDE